MSDFGVTAEPIGNVRVRKGALAPKKRAGIGAQPIDGTNGRRSHQPGSFRHTAESGSGNPFAVLTTRKRA
jgi:hypothetical protein